MTSISKNVRINKLADRVSESVIHIIEILKWSLLMKSRGYILTLIKKITKKNVNLSVLSISWWPCKNIEM